MVRTEAQIQAEHGERTAQIMDIDTLAKILCAIETRGKARTLGEAVAMNVELWMRYRYEANRLLEEISDWGYQTVLKEPRA